MYNQIYMHTENLISDGIYFIIIICITSFSSLDGVILDKEGVNVCYFKCINNILLLWIQFIIPCYKFFTNFRIFGGLGYLLGEKLISQQFKDQNKLNHTKNTTVLALKIFGGCSGIN